MSFVIFDTEYVADKGWLEEGFNGWKNREIIQIAALKIDSDLNVIDSLNLYIKPVKNKRISEYFTNLTGITNELMAEVGDDFPSAYKKFKAFVENCICYSHGWSFYNDDESKESDGCVMKETMSYYDITDNNLPNYQNIAFWFKEQYLKNNINITKQAPGEIASLLGVEHELRELKLSPHNALYDVYSILAGLKYLGFQSEKRI